MAGVGFDPTRISQEAIDCTLPLELERFVGHAHDTSHSGLFMLQP